MINKKLTAKIVLGVNVGNALYSICCTRKWFY